MILRPWLASLLAVVAAGCATTQGRFVPVGPPQAARSQDCAVEVFRSGAPPRDFARVARLDVHLEQTFFTRPRFDDALPELRRQACLSGADAVIDIDEDAGALVENRSYHVTAIGVKYRGPGLR